VLCEPPPPQAVAAAAAAAAAPPGALPAPASAPDADARDPETYDDGDFYGQLLREFLESAGTDAAAAAGADALRAGRGAKRRKAVDRRASKGRKLRYTVHEKLVNFMVPVASDPPPFAAQLFANLFGGGGRAAA
jgi:protein AATF/BFR2